MSTTNNTGHSLDAAKTSGLSPPPEHHRAARQYDINYRCGASTAEQQKQAEHMITTLMAQLFLGTR